MNLSQIQSLADIATLFLTNPETGEALRDEEGTHVGISLYNSKLPSKFKPFQRKLIGLNACKERELKLIDSKDKDANSKVVKIECAHFDRVQETQATLFKLSSNAQPIDVLNPRLLAPITPTNCCLQAATQRRQRIHLLLSLTI